MTSLFTSVILCKEIIYVVGLKTEKRRDKLMTQQRMRSLDASFYHFPIRKGRPIRNMFRLQCTLSFIYIMLATKERNVQRTKCPKNESSRVRIVLRTKHPRNETSRERIVQGTNRLENETSTERNVQRTNRPYIDVSFQGTKRLGNETSCYRNT